MSTKGGVDCAMEALQVGHHRSHHSSGKATAHEEGTRMRVIRIYPIAEELIYKLLCQASDLHVGIHIQVFDLEAICLEHFSYSDHIRMHLAP